LNIYVLLSQFKPSLLLQYCWNYKIEINLSSALRNGGLMNRHKVSSQIVFPGILLFPSTSLTENRYKCKTILKNAENPINWTKVIAAYPVFNIYILKTTNKNVYCKKKMHRHKLHVFQYKRFLSFWSHKVAREKQLVLSLLFTNNFHGPRDCTGKWFTIDVMQFTVCETLHGLWNVVWIADRTKLKIKTSVKKKFVFVPSAKKIDISIQSNYTETIKIMWILLEVFWFILYPFIVIVLKAVPAGVFG